MLKRSNPTFPKKPQGTKNKPHHTFALKAIRSHVFTRTGTTSCHAHSPGQGLHRIDPPFHFHFHLPLHFFFFCPFASSSLCLFVSPCRVLHIPYPKRPTPYTIWISKPPLWTPPHAYAHYVPGTKGHAIITKTILHFSSPR